MQKPTDPKDDIEVTQPAQEEDDPQSFLDKPEPELLVMMRSALQEPGFTGITLFDGTPEGTKITREEVRQHVMYVDQKRGEIREGIQRRAEAFAPPAVTKTEEKPS